MNSPHLKMPSFTTAVRDESADQPQPAAEKHISLIQSGTGHWIDGAFRGATLLSALSVLAIVILIVSELYSQSKLSIHQFGWGFFKGQNWDPVSGDFGALPFIFGTLLSSFLALLMAVPLGIGVAIFMNEMC